MKRISIGKNWQRHNNKKIKLTEPLSLSTITQNNFYEVLNVDDMTKIVTFNFSFEKFTHYTIDYLLHFLKSWISEIPQSVSLVFYPNFIDWLRNIVNLNLDGKLISDYIDLLKVLLNSQVKNHCYERINTVFINMFCKLYHRIQEEKKLQSIIVKHIYNVIVQNDYYVLSSEKDFQSMISKLYNDGCLENQLTGIRYAKLMYKRGESFIFYDNVLLDKLTVINARLSDGDFDGFSKIEREIIYESVDFSHLLLKNETFCKQQLKWIKNNITHFRNFKEICTNKSLWKPDKSLGFPLIRCLNLFLKLMSINEICDHYSFICDGMLSLPNSLKSEYAICSSTLMSAMKFIKMKNEEMLSYLTGNLSQFTIQNSFLLNIKRWNCQLTLLHMLFRLNIYKLENSVIEEIFNIVQESLDSNEKITDFTGFFVIIIKILTNDLIMKLKVSDDQNNSTNIHSYILSLCNGNDEIDQSESMLQLLQTTDTTYNKFKLPRLSDDKYAIFYITKISYLINSVFKKLLKLMLQDNITSKKRCIAALCLLFKSSHLTVLFLQESELNTIIEFFLSLIKDINSLDKQYPQISKVERKILLKNSVILFNYIFTNDCYVLKHEKSINNIATCVMEFIGDELISNKLALRKYFIKNANLVGNLFKIVLKLKENPNNYVKTYFENLRVLMKNGYKKFQSDQKCLVRKFIDGNLRILAENMLISQISDYYFLFSLKYWSIDDYIIPSSQIFMEIILGKFDMNIIAQYSMGEIIRLFYKFFVSLLNFSIGNTDNQILLDIVKCTIDTFIEFLTKYFDNQLVKKKILNFDYFDEQKFFEFWILLLIMRKNNCHMSRDIVEKLHIAVKNVNFNTRLSVHIYDLFYFLFENQAAKSNVSNRFLADNFDVISIIQNNQFYLQKLQNNFSKQFKSTNCSADQLKTGFNQNFVIKLPSKFKMTFKANFNIMRENSHYFEASLRFSSSETISIDVSNDHCLYPPDKEESVKLAFKIIVHLLHGSNLINCNLIRKIKSQKLLNSALMICFFIDDRIQMKSQSKSYLLDIIIYYLFINYSLSFPHREILHLMNYVVKSGCLPFYQIMLEIVVNHMKYKNFNSSLVTTNKNDIATIVKSTHSHQNWFGSDLCWKHLIDFVCK